MRKAAASAAALALFAAGAIGCSTAGGDGKEAAREPGRPPTAVEAARAGTSEIVEGVDVVGTLAPRYDAEVKSEYGGTVAEVHVTEWVRVRKGTPLARVDTREGEVVVQRAEAALAVAKASALEAETAAKRAEREHDRASKLSEAGLVTRQALDDAVTQKEATAARVAAARAQIQAAEEDLRHARTRIAKSVVRAPFDGVVAGRFVNPGEVVGEMQKVVFRIVDNRLLDLTVAVPSAEMAAVKPGQRLTFATDAFPDKVFAGTVKHVNPAVSEADRSVKVVAEVRNEPEVLKGGLFVKGRIETGRRPAVLQVPRSALLSWDVPGRTGEIYVVQDNVARRRTVRTGTVSGDRVEVASGLAAGETVVTRGGFNVRDGGRVVVVLPGGES